MPPKKINVKDRLSDGEVDLSMSDLDEVPVKEIAALKKAFSLDLSNNNLAVLPVTFPTLTHIIKLDLSKNQLTELPENFGDLVKLKHLDLYKNQLQHLPLSFCKLKALKWLDLKDNPLVSAVAKVAGPCLDSKQCQASARDVVNFFSQLQDQISTDLESRQKDRQKQLEKNQQKEMESKKAKKKETKAKHQNTNKHDKKDNKPVENSAKHSKKAKKLHSSDKKPKSTSHLFCWGLAFIIFTFLTLFVLTSIRYEHTLVVESTFLGWYTSVLNLVPPNLVEYVRPIGGFVSVIHQKTGRAVLDGVVYVQDTDNFFVAYKALGDFIENVMNKTKEQYKKLVS